MPNTYITSICSARSCDSNRSIVLELAYVFAACFCIALPIIILSAWAWLCCCCFAQVDSDSELDSVLASSAACADMLIAPNAIRLVTAVEMRTDFVFIAVTPELG